jgi:ribosomal protein S6
MDMKIYELTFEVPANLKEEESKSIIEKIGGFIVAANGKIEKNIEPLRKKLGYPIKKHDEVLISTLYISIEPIKLEELEKNIKAEPNILRYMILAKKQVEEASRQPVFRRKKPIEAIEQEMEKIIEDKKEKTYKPTKPKKVELKEIDQKIEEILSE